MQTEYVDMSSMDCAQNHVRRLTRERLQRHRLRLTEELREHLNSKIEKQREFTASKRVIYAAHTV